MALSTDDMRTQYPLPVYNYRVEINGETIAFSEASGFSVEYEPITFKESPVTSGKAGPVIRYMPGQTTPVNLTLKKGIVRQKSIKVLYDWISTTALNLIEKKDIIIRLCDEKGEPVISWKIINAFPTKLDAPGFDANSNEVAVESMELMADDLMIEES